MYHDETVLSTLFSPRIYLKHSLLEMDKCFFGIVSTDEMVDYDMESKSSSKKPTELGYDKFKIIYNKPVDENISSSQSSETLLSDTQLSSLSTS